jgi:hypothetical protein
MCLHLKRNIDFVMLDAHYTMHLLNYSCTICFLCLQLKLTEEDNRSASMKLIITNLYYAN